MDEVREKGLGAGLFVSEAESSTGMTFTLMGIDAGAGTIEGVVNAFAA